MAMLTSMYWLTQKLVDVPENDDWLTHNEIICMNKLRFPKRRADWRLGRWTAKRALLNVVPAPCGRLSEFIGPILNNVPQAPLYKFLFNKVAGQGGGTTNEIFSLIEIRAAADGAPEAFVNDKLIPVTLSLSHRNEIGFCAINPFRLAVGCDVEKVEPRSANFVTDYFTVEEEKLVSQAPEQDRHWLATLIWSAKESALKALRQGLRLDTRSVIVAFDKSGNNEDWNPLNVRYTETTRKLDGWWRIDGKFVQTIVAELFMESPIKVITLEKNFSNGLKNPTDNAFSVGFFYPLEIF
jgi:4'-phosphopantetheinyl transferase